MGKRIIRIYKHDQQNCPNPSPNTIYVVPQRCGTSIQTQQDSDSDASVAKHDIVSSVLDQNTNRNDNTDVNHNDGSHLY